MSVKDKSGLNTTKPRGLKRRCKKMVEYIMDSVKEFPCEGEESCGYWHTHVPTSPFMDSKHTPKSVRKLCAQTLIDASAKLVDISPNSDVKTHVVTTISLPELWGSQIIVFFGDNYFNTFFDRNSECQRWIPLPSYRNICKEWGLRIPNGFEVKGYREEIHDEDYERIGEIWFIGELS